MAPQDDRKTPILGLVRHVPTLVGPVQIHRPSMSRVKGTCLRTHISIDVRCNPYIWIYIGCTLWPLQVFFRFITCTLQKVNTRLTDQSLQPGLVRGMKQFNGLHGTSKMAGACKEYPNPPDVEVLSSRVRLNCNLLCYRKHIELHSKWLSQSWAVLSLIRHIAEAIGKPHNSRHLQES